jgi:hypothetical protein
MLVQLWPQTMDTKTPRKKLTTTLWNNILCSLEKVNLHFREANSLHLLDQIVSQPSSQQETRGKQILLLLKFSLLFDPQDGGSKFL